MCSQMVVLLLMALYYARRLPARSGPAAAPALVTRALRLLRELPERLAAELDAMRDKAHELASAYSGARNFFFLGRGNSYPLAM
jgi:glucosamine--fructose-6-phosphate aminotransferase (isomerizing)